MLFTNIDVAAALAHCFCEISRLSSQCPANIRSDSYRSSFLLRPVRDEQWARVMLEFNVATPLSCIEVHTRLPSSVVLLLDLNSTAGHNNDHAVSPTCYGERYGKFPTTARRQIQSRLAAHAGDIHPKATGKRSLICWHCEQEGHPRHLCPELSKQSTPSVLTDRVKSRCGSVKEAAKVFWNFLIALETDSLQMQGNGDVEEESDFAAYFLADDSDDPDDAHKYEIDHTTHIDQGFVAALD
jgi:hypothetical protein